MIVKLFEIRDNATCIPAMAILLIDKNYLERRLMGRVGFVEHSSPEPNTIIFMRLTDQEAHADPYSWGDTRTMREAHKYLIENFNKHISGTVIDVRFILGETDAPAESDMGPELS